MPKNRLKLTEIFHSLQGEARDAGQRTVFIRLTGCPLRCQYCDTEYAFYGGQWWDFDAILAEIAPYQAQYICVTGGEPLIQPACRELLKQLCDLDYHVSLETSGAYDIAEIDSRVSRVVDIKTPDSKECDKNLWDNIHYLTSHDQLKFVICSREDFEWAKQIIIEKELLNKCEIWFSPSANQVDPTQLAEWILADKLAVRFQMQLHKILWQDAKGK